MEGTREAVQRLHENGPGSHYFCAGSHVPRGWGMCVTGTARGGAERSRDPRRWPAPPTRGRSPSNDSVQRVGGGGGGGADSSGLRGFLPSTAQPPPSRDLGVQASARVRNPGAPRAPCRPPPAPCAPRFSRCCCSRSWLRRSPAPAEPSPTPRHSPNLSPAPGPATPPGPGLGRRRAAVAAPTAAVRPW